MNPLSPNGRQHRVAVFSICSEGPLVRNMWHRACSLSKTQWERQGAWNGLLSQPRKDSWLIKRSIDYMVLSNFDLSHAIECQSFVGHIGKTRADSSRGMYSPNKGNGANIHAYLFAWKGRAQVSAAWLWWYRIENESVSGGLASYERERSLLS